VAVALVAIGIGVLYIITPGSAYGPKDLPVQGFVNIRWLMPAIVVGAALTASAVATLGSVGIVLELAGLAGALDGIHLTGSVPGSAVTSTIAVLAALAALALLARRGIRSAGSRAGAAVAVAACAALVILARLDQNTFDRRSYAGADPTFAWIDAHAPSGHRIGIAGVADTVGLSPILPAFGPRLGNTAEYVGDPVRHSIHLPATEAGFDRELRRGRYDLLLIGLQLTDNTDVWARRAGFTLVAESPRLALYAAPH
jgi:hypothetical protein